MSFAWSENCSCENSSSIFSSVAARCSALVPSTANSATAALRRSALRSKIALRPFVSRSVRSLYCAVSSAVDWPPCRTRIANSAASGRSAWTREEDGAFSPAAHWKHDIVHWTGV